MKLQFRWMIKADLPLVCAIPGNPWDAEEYEIRLRQPYTIGQVAYVNVGAEEVLVGSLVYTLQREQETIHIDLLVVEPDVQNIGVLRQMLDRVQCKLYGQHYRRMTLRISEYALAMQVALRQAGMFACKVLAGNGYDVYEFEWQAPRVTDSEPAFQGRNRITEYLT